MADRVAYTGAPDTPSLRLEPTPAMHVDAPPAAFGVNVGQAVENLGQVQEGAGKELFARALAFQDLTNHATARGASVKTAHEQAALWGEFDSKGGMDAGPEALNKLHSDLEAVRQKNGEGLNPTANELYQNDAASTQNRLYVYSATHSAQAVKQYDMDNIKAGAETRRALVTGAATDPTAAIQSWEKDKKDAIDLGHHNGEAPDSPAVKARILENHNATSLAAVTGFVSRREPDKLKEFIAFASKKGMLTGEALDKATKELSELQDRIGAAQTAQEAEAGGGSVEEKLLRAKEINDKKTGGDPIAVSRSQAIIMTNDAAKRNVDKQNLDKAISTIDEFITKIPPGTAMSAEQLRHQAELQEAFGVIKSNDERAGQTDTAINRILRQHYDTDITITPERQQTMTTLLGLSRRNSTEFVKIDASNPALDLTAWQRKEIRDRQESMRKSGNSPQFNDRALEATMAHNKEAIESAFGKRGTTEYNDFHDNLSMMLDLEREEGKIIDPKRADEIATRLMQTKILNPGILYVPFTGKKGFEYQVPDDRAEEIRKQLGPNLTDSQVQAVYLTQLHKQLYGTVTPDAPPKAGGKISTKANPPPVIVPPPVVPTLPVSPSAIPTVESYDR